MLQWSIRFPEFAEFNGFLYHLSKLHYLMVILVTKQVWCASKFIDNGINKETIVHEIEFIGKYQQKLQ